MAPRRREQGETPCGLPLPLPLTLTLTPTTTQPQPYPNQPPHGPHFRRWADRFERVVPGMSISTCHAYDIHYKFRYSCTSCAAEIGRQSKSIDLARQRCGPTLTLTLNPYP